MTRWSLCILSFLLMAAPLSAQKLTIYCEEDAPMQFRASDGTLTGMTVEIVREIQKRVSNADPIEMVPWARGLDALNTEPNTVLFSIGRTAERNDLYQWVGPIADSAYGFYVRADSAIAIKNLDEARNVRAIGVYRDDIRDQYLTRAGFRNLERTTDNIQNFKKLMSGRIDMYASSSNDIKGNAEQAGYRLSDVRLVHVFLRSQVFIAMSKKTNPAVVSKWNAALAAMKRDGSFKTIFKKYYPDRNLPGPAITKF